MNSLKDKTALIIGASSEGGVGWTTAERLAQQGARLIVAARRTDALAKLAARIDGLALRCDVADETSVIELAREIASRRGGIDFLVNCAGHPAQGLISTVESSALQQTTAVEFHGTWYVIRHLAPVVSDGGAMVMISSLASTHVVPGFAAYAGAKAAANALVRYAAIELAPRRIRINAVLPGLIDTPMNDAFRHDEAIMRVMLKEVPFGRMAKADEVASAVSWLCQDDCFATGILLTVDGGNHLRRAPFPDELPVGALAEAP